MLIEICEAEAQPLKAIALGDFADRLTDRRRNWKLKETTQSLFLRGGNVDGAHTYSLNYLEYLEGAWARHHAVVLTPDIVWYTLLCELSMVVGMDPERFRHLFSEEADKQEIIIHSDDPVVMPIEGLIKMLEGLVPTDMAPFLPEFSTSTDRSRHAFHAAFCDMVSPYYEYSMLVCGIPAIEVFGTSEDWTRLRDAWLAMGTTILAGLEDYHRKVAQVLNAILMNISMPTTEFWENIFRLERCGSGSDTEAYGWFTDLFKESPSVRYVSNFSSHVATVKYKHLNTQKSYEMKVGLFAANLQRRFMIPHFGFLVYEKTEMVTTTDAERARLDAH